MTISSVQIIVKCITSFEESMQKTGLSKAAILASSSYDFIKGR